WPAWPASLSPASTRGLLLQGSALQVKDRVLASRGQLGLAALGHLAVALEEHAFLDHDHGRLDVTEDARSAPQLYTLGRQHVAHDLAADDDHARPDAGVDDALLTHDQRVLGVDLAAEAAVQHDGPFEGVLPLDLGTFVDEGGQVAGLGGLHVPAPGQHRGSPGSKLPTDTLLVDRIDGALAGTVLIDLGDVAVEEPALGDHERVRLDVAADPACLGDFDVAGCHHVALVLTHDDRIDRLHLGADHTLLADDETAGDVQLPADFTFDLDGVGDVELALDLRVIAGDGHECDRGAVRLRERARALLSRHRSLLQST